MCYSSASIVERVFLLLGAAAVMKQLGSGSRATLISINNTWFIGTKIRVALSGPQSRFGDKLLRI